MAFGDGASLIDDFNRANGTLNDGTNWANLNSFNGTTLTITSNQVTSGGTATGESYYLPSTFGPDLDAYITIATLPGTNNSVRIYVRVRDPGGVQTWDAYGVRYQQNATPFLTIERWDNGSLTTIASKNLTLSAGDKIGIRCEGSTISGWTYSGGTWTQQVSGTDATYASANSIAFGVRGTTGRVDDFYAGPIPAASAFVPRAILL